MKHRRKKNRKAGVPASGHIWLQAVWQLGLRPPLVVIVATSDESLSVIQVFRYMEDGAGGFASQDLGYVSDGESRQRFDVPYHTLVIDADGVAVTFAMDELGSEPEAVSKPHFPRDAGKEDGLASHRDASVATARYRYSRGDRGPAEPRDQGGGKDGV